MADRIQLRRDTAANWTQYNPILLEGEPGIELDTDQWKLGDGIHTWSQLAYRGGEYVQQTGQSTTVAMSQKAVSDIVTKHYTGINRNCFVHFSEVGKSCYIYYYNGPCCSDLLSIPNRPCTFKGLWKLPTSNPYASLVFLDENLCYLGKINTDTGVIEFDPQQTQVPQNAKYIALNSTLGSDGMGSNYGFVIESQSPEQLTTGINIIDRLDIFNSGKYVSEITPDGWPNTKLTGVTMWLAKTPGTYTHAGNIVVEEGEVALIVKNPYNNSYSKTTIISHQESTLNKLSDITRTVLQDNSKYVGINAYNVLRFSLAAQGHKELYFNGYVSSNGDLSLIGSGEHKVLVARCNDNSKFSVFVESGGDDSVGLFNFYNENFEKLLSRTHITSDEPFILRPADYVQNAKYVAITIMINGHGNYDSFTFGTVNGVLRYITDDLVDGCSLIKRTSFVSALGITSNYLHGFLFNSGGNINDLILVGNGEHKVLIAKVVPGLTYKAYIKIIGDSIGIYSFFDKDLQKLDNVYRGLSAGVVTTLTAPEGAEYFGMTMELNNVGNYKECFFVEENEYVKYTERNFNDLKNDYVQFKSSRKPYSDSVYGLNLVHFPWKNGAENISDLIPKYFKVQPNSATNSEFISISGCNQKGYKVERSDFWNRYSPVLNFKVYAEDFVNKIQSKTYVNIYGYAKEYVDGVQEPYDCQCYVSVFYGLSKAEIENFDGAYFTKCTRNRVNYINGEIFVGDIEYNCVVNNPNLDFAISNAAYLGWNIPVYPSIKDENGDDLEFSGIIVQLLTQGYDNVSRVDAYPVCVSLGANSINTLDKLPYTVLEANISITSNDILNSEKTKIKESLLPDRANEDQIVISPATSDKMAFYGCSYTESYYAIKNKSWVNKLSNLLDLPAMNFGVSGNRIVDMSLRLRQDGNPYGTVGIKELKPTYIVIQNIGNESLYSQPGATLELYMAQVKEMVENIKAIGAIPMFGMDYYISNKALDAQLKEFADRLGIIYCPIGTIGERFSSRKYAGFWGGDHPATRTNEATTEEWYHSLKNLNVQKSVKIFRVRDEFLANVSNVNDLNYDYLPDRLRKFVEINCGELSLNEGNNSWKSYDALDVRNYSSQNNSNEYGVLIGGSEISFTDYALIEFISPKVKARSVIMIPSSISGLKFYMKNANIPVEPYSTSRFSGAFYVTKEVWNNFNASVGDKFTSDASGAAQIEYAGKVMGQEYGGYVLVFDTTETLNGNAGTLVNVSTQAQTPYSSCSYNLSRYKYGFLSRINTPVAGFEEVAATYEDGVYKIELNNYNFWEYDKLKIIVQKSGAFSLGSPYCRILGGEDKIKRFNKPEPKCSGDSELCSETGFGTVDNWNNVWNKEEGILFESMPEEIRDYPIFNYNNSHIVLTRKDIGFSNKISKTFTIDGLRGYRKMYIRVTARLFPKIYNQNTNDDYHTTTRQITPTSNDYGRLVVAVSYDNYNTPAVFEAFVGCGWAEKYFEVLISPYCTSVNIEVYRNPHDFEETEKLASGWPMQVCDISVSMHNM